MRTNGLSPMMVLYETEVGIVARETTSPASTSRMSSSFRPLGAIHDGFTDALFGTATESASIGDIAADSIDALVAYN